MILDKNRTTFILKFKLKNFQNISIVNYFNILNIKLKIKHVPKNILTPKITVYIIVCVNHLCIYL